MDLDDLLDETPIKQPTEKKGAKEEDDWGFNEEDQEKVMKPWFNYSSNVPDKKEAADNWDDGDFIKEEKKEKPKIQKQKPNIQMNDEKLQNEWGIMETPAASTGKLAKFNESKFQVKKKEEADDLGWGDEANFETKKPEAFKLTGSAYYNAPDGNLSIEHMPANKTKVNGEKCFVVFLGGADLEHGLCQSSMMPKGCSSLKCTNCDKKVHRFLNAVWDSSVDYMFVRNF